MLRSGTTMFTSLSHWVHTNNLSYWTVEIMLVYDKTRLLTKHDHSPPTIQASRVQTSHSVQLTALLLHLQPLIHLTGDARLLQYHYVVAPF